MTLKYLILALVTVSFSILLSLKVYGLFEVYREESIEIMDKVRAVAEDVRSGDNNFSPEQMSDYLLLVAERYPELFLIKSLTLMTILFINSAFIIVFLGHIFEKRAAKDGDS